MKSFLSFLLLCSFFISCQTLYELKDGNKISYQEIKQEVQSIENKDKHKNHKSTLRVALNKSSLENDKKGLYKKINDLTIGKLSKDFSENNHPVFYQKTGNSHVSYYKLDQISIFKPTSLSDKTYNKEVNRILKLLESGQVEMNDVEKALNSDYGINVSYFKSDWEKKDLFTPEIQKLLTTGRKFQTATVLSTNTSNLTYKSIVQNIGKVKKVEVVEFYIIRLK